MGYGLWPDGCAASKTKHCQGDAGDTKSVHLNCLLSHFLQPNPAVVVANTPIHDSLPTSTSLLAALNVIRVDYVQVKGLTGKQAGSNEFSSTLTESVLEFWIFESVYANMDDNPC
jgi:hypothetical protein